MGGSPVIFLSHSGADTDAARTFRRRLLASPDARAAGLKVWFDKKWRPRTGQTWQPQIEQAITQEATAFVVYVGSLGIINWTAPKSCGRISVGLIQSVISQWERGHGR